MKKLSTILASIFFLVMIGGASAAPATVNFIPNTTVVGTGQVFTVGVDVALNGNVLSGMQIKPITSDMATMGEANGGNLFGVHQIGVSNFNGYLVNTYIGKYSSTNDGRFADISYTAGSKSGYFVADSDKTILCSNETYINENGVEDIRTIELTQSNATVLIDDAPEIADMLAVTIKEGDAITIVPTVSDKNGDQVTLTTSTLPAGSAFDGTSFTWTPTKGQKGSYDVLFTSTDSWGLNATKNLHIDVGQGAKNPLDVDGSGTVDQLDMNIIKSFYGQDIGQENVAADVNSDGRIDIQDLSLVAQAMIE
jgi:hypothetical protein